MGFRLTWLSIQGKSRDDIFRALDVEPSGRRGTGFGEGMAGRLWRDGAYLFLAYDDKGRHMEKDLLERVSMGAEVIVCHVHEGCMFSHAAFWRDGGMVWRVEHDGDGGVRHLDITGCPPPVFEAIRTALEAKQANEPPRRFRVDYMFGAPVDLCATLAGFRHDRAMSPSDDLAFEVLERLPRSSAAAGDT